MAMETNRDGHHQSETDADFVTPPAELIRAMSGGESDPSSSGQTLEAHIRRAGAEDKYNIERASGSPYFEPPFTYVCKLFDIEFTNVSSKRRAGSAIAFNGNYFVTAAHNLLYKGRWARSCSIAQFDESNRNWGVSGTGVLLRKGGNYWIPPEFERARNSDERSLYDYALLRLDGVRQSVSSDYIARWSHADLFPEDGPAIGDRYRLHSFGFPASREDNVGFENYGDFEVEHPYTSSESVVTKYPHFLHGAVVGHFADTVKGFSGGALISEAFQPRNNGQKFQVMGIHTGSHPNDRQAIFNFSRLLDKDVHRFIANAAASIS